MIIKKHIYTIKYDIKKNGGEFERKIYVMADTAREAKEYFQSLYCGNCFYDPKYHAFHIKVKRTDDIVMNFNIACISA